MNPVLSFTATLIFFGMAFSLLHAAIVWLGLPDLAALLLFAIPVVAYLAYCTQSSTAAMVNSAVRVYLSFAAVTLSAAGLVYLIG